MADFKARVRHCLIARDHAKLRILIEAACLFLFQMVEHIEVLQLSRKMNRQTFRARLGQRPDAPFTPFFVFSLCLLDRVPVWGKDSEARYNYPSCHKRFLSSLFNGSRYPPAANADRSHIHAAIHRQHMPRDIGRLVAREERDRIRNILDRTAAAKWNAPEHVCACFFGQIASVMGVSTKPGQPH